MKKSTKGALAAATAALLLVGGAGSLAYWTASADVDDVAVASGELNLTPVDCGAGWLLDGGTPYVDQSLVPGDTVTIECTYTIVAAGEHLEATVDAELTDMAAAGALAPFLDVAATATIGGTPVSTITELNDGNTLAVGVTVEFTDPGTEDNTSNVSGGLTATLASLAVTLTQAHL